MARLLAIVGVERAQAVRCQAHGCQRPVYRRIHVVEDEGRLQVLGSTCFEILYGDRLPGEAFYTGASDRRLSDEERRQLEQNTAALIAAFEAERQAECQRQQQAERRATEAHQRYNNVPRRPPATPSVPKAAAVGRQVKCQFCGNAMLTQLDRAPAVGYKCQACRDAGVYLSLSAKKRQPYKRRW